MKRILFILLITTIIFPLIQQLTAQSPVPDALVEESFNYMRGKSSQATVKMTIHRPDWERRMTMDAWTKGQSDSLIRITAPSKDRGNGTLKQGREMWMFNPKVNRVIKLPPSMMSQAWMGSDFSNNDLAKTDSILNDYTHTLEKSETVDGKRVYWIKSIPKPQAPVVWGMQKMAIREDRIMLAQQFYDEDLKLVKSMTTHEIREMGGRLYPSRWRMEKTETPGSYTELSYSKLTFPDDLPNNVFTVANLKNPRR